MNDIVPSPAQPPARPRVSLVTSYLLLAPCLFGLSGLHRFYQGRILSGVIWLFTGGFCGIGNIVDLVMMRRMVDDVNRGAKVW